MKAIRSLTGILTGIVLLTAGPVAAPALAGGQTAKADGVVHYQAGDQVVTRNMTIAMERQTDGSPTIMLSAGNWSIRTDQAFMRESRGARIAYAAFENAWSMDGTTKHLLLKGVKLQGANGMIYQGTVYKTSPEQLAASGETFADCIKDIREDGDIDDDWQIAGTFYFKAEGQTQN